MRATTVGGVVETVSGCDWLQRRRWKEVVGLLEVFEGCLECRAKPKVKGGKKGENDKKYELVRVNREYYDDIFSKVDENLEFGS
ncbi:hypothetical protein Tco_1335507 [Tanacetum coccineum]